MPSNINQGEEQMLHPFAKIKLQLFPLDQRIRKGLEKDGHNPFLELTLKARKKITSVLEHLFNKWGCSNMATGELMLFPFNIVVDNWTNYKRWSSSDTGVSAADVHAAIGSPEIFRLRYGWVSTQPVCSPSSLALNWPEPGPLGRVSCCSMETTVGSKIPNEVTNKELEPSNINEVTNVMDNRTVLSEPHRMVHLNQTEVKNEDLDSSKTGKIDNDARVNEKVSAEPFKHEESRMQNDLSFTSLLWSDLSNISIGGLLSEATMQGRFDTQDIKLGGDRLVSHPTSLVSDSLDAFIDQLKDPQTSPTLYSDVPSSILDAEDTCHTFAFQKPSSLGKDSLSHGCGAFPELTNHDVACRPFKCPKFEANAEDGVAQGSAVQEPKTNALPCSAGLCNNENSLGLSSIRWNDSLGPFDLPVTSRQINKDDSISISGFVR